MSKRKYDEEKEISMRRKKSNETQLPALYHLFHGEIASVKEYGVFVKIPGFQKQGLVHKSQISKSRVDDPTEMFSKGEMVYCKVISIDEDSDKIGLGMKMVNQTTGQDQDPNNVELRQDEKRRKQTGCKQGRQKIELDAVFNTVCKKCNGQGHLAQDCFKTGDTTYDLIPDLDEYMASVQTTSTDKTKKKEKKHKKKKKKKKHKRSSSDSSDSDQSPKKKRKHDTKYDSDESRSKKKKKKKKHSKYYSSSDSDG